MIEKANSLPSIKNDKKGAPGELQTGVPDLSL